MELKGIKANFLGDSITEGHGVEDKEHHIYWQRLRDNCGLAEARGYGIGGTRIAVQHLKENEKWDQDFLSRVDLMDPDADLIVVFGGTNDFGHGDAPLGAMSDRTPYTFYGACHRLMKKLIERYPEAQIVFMTPLHRMTEERGERRLKDFVETIKEVAAYYSLPVLDLYATSGMQPAVDVCRERLMPDGLHPSDEGHAIIARRLGEFLKTL
jgi:lysophospholipase L1-like esterase